MTNEPAVEAIKRNSERKERVANAFKAAADVWLTEMTAGQDKMTAWMDMVRDSLLRYEREIQALTDRLDREHYVAAELERLANDATLDAGNIINTAAKKIREAVDNTKPTPFIAPKSGHPWGNLDAYTLRHRMVALADELAELIEDEANRYKHMPEKSLTRSHHNGIVAGTRRALAMLRRELASDPAKDAAADASRTQNRLTRKDLGALVDLCDTMLKGSSARIQKGGLAAVCEEWEAGFSAALTRISGEILKRLESR